MLDAYTNPSELDNLKQKKQIDAIKQSVKEVEDLTELIEKSFGLTQDLILGKPSGKHKLNINQSMTDNEDLKMVEASKSDDAQP